MYVASCRCYSFDVKSVVICSSNKFADEVKRFAAKLERRGVTVFLPYFYSAIHGEKRWGQLDKVDKEFVALGLTSDHFSKIQNADVIFIYNKGGYSGNSVTLEIGYAVALGKPVYALEEDTGEVCRHVLFREIIPSAEELAKRLQ